VSTPAGQAAADRGDESIIAYGVIVADKQKHLQSDCVYESCF
jgi:hypothetical protein